MDDKVLDASYERLFGEGTGLARNSERFFARFYQIFMRDPAVAALFAKTDMNAQVGMLKRSFFKLLGYHLTREWSPELDKMAHAHSGLGIDADLFDFWLECLLETVAEQDALATPETLLAWRLALTPGVVYMKHWKDVHGA